MTNIDKLKEKLSAQKLRNEIAGAYNMYQSKEAQDNFNNEMVKKLGNIKKYINSKPNLKKETNFGMLKRMLLNILSGAPYYILDMEIGVVLLRE